MPESTQQFDRSLDKIQLQLETEWEEILQYWITHVTDLTAGGFHGSVDNNNIPDLNAPRGIVQYSRILWSFSRAFLFFENPGYRQIADRAFNYIIDHFYDETHGGVYWSVDSNGHPLESKKQIYGLAFCMYGMSEYFKISGNKDVLAFCQHLFQCIEKYSLDQKNGGYFEAFTREWENAEDLRLSEKDANEKKTMNTHLHIIEAYANLYTIWKEPSLENSITALLEVFDKFFINKQNFHLNLFMDENWNSRSRLVSFGHDIEAAWLLQQCAEIISNEKYTAVFKTYAVYIAKATEKAIDSDGGIWYEYDEDEKKLIKEKHSWPQAEAAIGFMNAYQLSGDETFLRHALNNLQFIWQYIKDRKNGEWFWGVDEHHWPMLHRDKAGFWKCPYHNTRACMELIKRMDTISTN